MTSSITPSASKHASTTIFSPKSQANIHMSRRQVVVSRDKTQKLQTMKSEAHHKFGGMSN
jgi:hypothetical protein